MSGINYSRMIMLVVGMFLLQACGQMNAATPQNELTASPSETQGDTPQSTEGNTNQMTPSLPTPADAGLQNLIEVAKADLAQRLAVSINDVAALESVSVTWPDASLGCPQEGMAYAQVLTAGYLIRLKSGEQEFEYHTGKGSTVIFCENPSPPVPGTPLDV